MSVKDRFYEMLYEWVNTKNENNFYWDKEKYSKCLQEVKAAKNIRKKKTIHYRRLKRYDILSIDGEEKLIAPITLDAGEIRYYVCYEDLFSVIEETHLAIGHGGRTRMLDELKRKYKNVTVQAVMMYLNLCKECQKKPKIHKKEIVVKPLLHSEMNSRCQVDFIDLQTTPDGNYKFIMVYEDHLTKFVILHALQTNHAEEVAYNLLNIFTTFGAPNIFHSGNGEEFSKETVEILCSMWPDIKIVQGKPSHSLYQESAECDNEVILNMLTTWMETNQSTQWSEGLKFIQAMKNRAYHEEIKCSPHEAMFGCTMKMGIASSIIPQNMLKNLQTEEDLQKILTSENESVEQENVNSESESFTEINSERDIDCEILENGNNDEENKVIKIETNTYATNKGYSVDEEEIVKLESPSEDINNDSSTSKAQSSIEGDFIKSFRKAKTSLEKRANKMKFTSAIMYSNPEICQNVRLKMETGFESNQKTRRIT